MASMKGGIKTSRYEPGGRKVREEGKSEAENYHLSSKRYKKEKRKKGGERGGKKSDEV